MSSFISTQHVQNFLEIDQLSAILLAAEAERLFQLGNVFLSGSRRDWRRQSVDRMGPVQHRGIDGSRRFHHVRPLLSPVHKILCKLFRKF